MNTEQASWASSPGRRANMQANRRRDTAPEMAVRRLVHARGFRYRVDFPPLARLNRRADLVFTRAQVAVFIDGCYWHGCSEHSSIPRTNVEYWGPKISRNRARDEDTDQQLRDAGWTVVRMWEHEPSERIAAVVMETVAAARRRQDECS